MTCQAGASGACGQCDACTGRAAFEWGSVAGAGARSELAEAGQQTWKSLGFEGWGSDSERSAFCEMLERIAQLLNVGRSIQEGLRDPAFEKLMLDLAAATWRLKPPQALRDAQQLRKVEAVLNTQIVPPVRAIAAKIGAISAPESSAKSKSLFGFMKKKKLGQADPGVDADALKEAKALGTEILATGQTMSQGLNRFKTQVTIAQNKSAFASTQDSLMASLPTPGLRAAGRSGDAVASTSGATSREKDALEFKGAMAFVSAAGSGRRGGDERGAASGTLLGTNRGPSLADSLGGGGGRGGSSAAGLPALDFPRGQQYALDWDARGGFGGREASRESSGSRIRQTGLAGRSEPLMLT